MSNSTEKNFFHYLDGVNNKSYDRPDNNDKKGYPQFMMNKGLSYYPDTILLVNEVNVDNLTNEMHYDFLYHALERRNRRSKWFKEDRDENINLIQQYYEVNVAHAREMLKLFSDEDFETIKKALEKGG